MKKLYFLFTFIFLIFSIPLISAQCLDIKTAKTLYLAGETFQVEITGNLIKPLTYNNIYFYCNGKEYFPIFSLEQIAANKWIVFFDIPEKYGLNELSVAKVICRENETLKEESKKISFTVKKPLQYYYSSLADKVRTRSAYLNSDELSLALIALTNFPELTAEGKNALLKKGTGECWPSPVCTVKSTSLAILALGNNTEKAKNWLFDSQNSVDNGIWMLVVESDSEKKCNLTINEKVKELSIPLGINEFSLDFPDAEIINVSLDCNVNSAKISHTYLGKVHEFSLGIINNKKCWGKTYKSECNAEATAYALQIFRDTKAESWLVENAKTTEEIAYAYIYTKKPDFNEWLVNNQHPLGYWSNFSLTISNISSVSATVSAIKAIENAKAKSWIRENLDNFSFEEQALALQVFSDEIEPIVSLEQGIIKANPMQNITFKITNKGIFPVTLKAVFYGASQNIILPPKTTLPLTFSIPQIQEFTISSIDITYNFKNVERSYSVPLVIIPLGTKTNIINQTVSEKTLKTANFQFLESEINETININEVHEVNITIRNLASEPLTIDFAIWGLSEVIEEIPLSITLKPNSLETLTIKFKSKYPFDYLGQIIAESKGQSVSIPVYISAKQQVISEKSCSELNGKICSSGYSCSGNLTITKEGECCLGTCVQSQVKEKVSMKTISIIMIILAIIIVILFVLLKLRKPKKPALTRVLEKIKEESKMPFREIETEEKKFNQ
ncbi:MAG: hypothetical protein QW041_00420 [Candidatus Pacearchaeota archaeon]